jgi:hypothetical protein
MYLFDDHPKLRETATKYNTQTYFTVNEVAKFLESRVPAGQLFAILKDERKANISGRYNVSRLLAIFVIKQIAALSPISSGNVIVNCVTPSKS